MRLKFLNKFMTFFSEYDNENKLKCPRFVTSTKANKIHPHSFPLSIINTAILHANEY